jgi:hypothetical protein
MRVDCCLDTKFPYLRVEALLIFINPKTINYSSHSRIIEDLTGGVFHKGLPRRLASCKDGKVFIKRHHKPIIPPKAESPLAFSTIIFVIDKDGKRLSELLHIGLMAAQRARIHSVGLPMPRRKEFSHLLELSEREYIAEFLLGLKLTAEEQPRTLECVALSFFNQDQLFQQMQQCSICVAANDWITFSGHKGQATEKPPYAKD